MTKLRPAASVEEALTRIMNQVPGGYETMAAVCAPLLTPNRTCSASLIRKWGDPARAERMPVEVVIALDLLYAEHGGIGSPIFEMFEYRRDEARAGRFQLEQALAEASIELATEGGQAVAALIRAGRLGATAQDKSDARRELSELDAVISRVAPALAPDREAPT